jgi:hypothetical protein
VDALKLGFEQRREAAVDRRAGRIGQTRQQDQAGLRSGDSIISVDGAVV